MIFKKIFLISLSLILLLSFSACTQKPQPLADEITFNPNDFVLKDAGKISENAAGHQIIDLFDSYFTDADYGDAYFGENGSGLHLNLVKGSSQRENIARFVELADAELERNGFSPVRTHEVDFSKKELASARDQLAQALQEHDVPYHALALDTQRNRIIVGYSNISASYKSSVLNYIDKKYVIFEKWGEFKTSIEDAG